MVCLPYLSMIKPALIALIAERDAHWVQSCQSIAKLFPEAWGQLISALTPLLGTSDVNILDIQLAEQDPEFIVFTMVSDTMKVIQTIPVNMMMTGVGLVEYINCNPVGTVVQYYGQNSSQRNMISSVLNITKQQYPGMYVNITRMIEIEEMLIAGHMFKTPTTETLQ